jgi:uncharacterized protein (TIGR02996 family)
MPRITLRQLRALGLSWPPGPVDPPAGEDETFDLDGEATGCESLYADTKGDTRFLDQKAMFEALAKRVADLVPQLPIAPPITRRKLMALSREWPFPYPEGLDEPIDIVAGIDRLAYADIHEYTGGRQSYLQAQLASARAIAEQLELLHVAFGTTRAPAPAPATATAPAPATSSPSDLLRRVLDHPDDTAARLAYAASLGDDDPRAQFIRLQCEAFALPEWSPRRALLEARASKLREMDPNGWGRIIDDAGDYRGAGYTGPDVRFERGFVESVDLGPSDDLRILRTEPIRELRWKGDAAPLSAVDFGHVRALVVHQGPIRVDRDPPWLRIAEALELSSVVDGHDALRAIVGSPARAPALVKLAVQYDSPDAFALRALARSDFAKRLKALSLVTLHGEQLRALAEGTYRALERLDLEGTLIELTPKLPETRSAAGTLSGLSGLVAPALGELSLRRFALSAGDGATLASLSLPKLRSFLFAGSDVDGRAFEALGSAAWASGLESVWFHAKCPPRDATPFLSRLGAPLRSLAILIEELEGVGDALSRSAGIRELVALRTYASVRPRDLAAIVLAAPKLEAVTLVSGRASAGDGAAVLSRAGFRPLANIAGAWVKAQTEK